MYARTLQFGDKKCLTDVELNQISPVERMNRHQLFTVGFNIQAVGSQAKLTGDQPTEEGGSSHSKYQSCSPA